MHWIRKEVHGVRSITVGYTLRPLSSLDFKNVFNFIHSDELLEAVQDLAFDIYLPLCIFYIFFSF